MYSADIRSRINVGLTLVHPIRHKMLNHCWLNVGPPSPTLKQHWFDSKCCVCWVAFLQDVTWYRWYTNEHSIIFGMSSTCTSAPWRIYLCTVHMAHYPCYHDYEVMTKINNNPIWPTVQKLSRFVLLGKLNCYAGEMTDLGFGFYPDAALIQC